MAWSDVKLADVTVESFPEIETGSYTFTLLPGATTRINNFDVEELVVSAAIVGGANAGRRVFLQYPADSVHSETGKPVTWGKQALKKLEIALGTEQTEGETPTDFLNRVATNGHSLFQMNIAPDKKGKAKAQLFSVGPAA